MSSTPPRSRPCLRVGLTGGIASGKSSVEQQLVNAGIPVLDADAVTHQLLRDDKALQGSIINTFGPEVLSKDGSINRRVLGRMVFKDESKRLTLGTLIHPKVREAIDAFFSQQQANPLAIASVALIYENNLVNRFDTVWLVTCPPEQQRERLIHTRGMTPEEADRRLAAQLPINEKIRRAEAEKHPIIDNSGNLQQLSEQVNALLHSVVQLNEGSGAPR